MSVCVCVCVTVSVHVFSLHLLIIILLSVVSLSIHSFHPEQLHHTREATTIITITNHHYQQEGLAAQNFTALFSFTTQ